MTVRQRTDGEKDLPYSGEPDGPRGLPAVAKSILVEDLSLLGIWWGLDFLLSAIFMPSAPGTVPGMEP